MTYRVDKTSDSTSIVIDGFENGIASSPYLGISNMRNINNSYYPSVAYVNYKRQASTLNGSGIFYAGSHSVDAGNNSGWIFQTYGGSAMANPVQEAISELGLIYILDENGQVWKQSAVGSSTFANIGNDGGRLAMGAGGIAYWNKYLVVFGGGLVEFCGDGTGDAGITSANWNLNGTGASNGGGRNSAQIITNTSIGSPYDTYVFPDTSTSIANTFETIPKFKIGDPVTFTTTGTLPAPLVVGTTYYLSYYNNYQYIISPTATSTLTSYFTPLAGDTSATFQDNWTGTSGVYSIFFSNTTVRDATFTNGTNTITWTGALPAGTYTKTIIIVIKFTSDGSGIHTMTDNASILPIGGCTSLSVSSSSGTWVGETILTLLSYVNPKGVTVTGKWQEATGFYNIVMLDGTKIYASFTNGSTSINLTSQLLYITYGSGWTVEFLDTTVTNYKPHVSKVDGSLYFANGQNIGRLAIGANTNQQFYPWMPQSYSVSTSVASIPAQFKDVVTNMIDLKGEMIVAGNKDIYVWDYLSASTSSPTPIYEQIYAIKNVLNNIYVLAGTKGNIYVSNGYSAQLLYKMPDYIAGVIDPVWQWGDLDSRRSRLLFQALAKTAAGTNILAGIFSLNIAPTVVGDSAQGLNMEAQNSYGLTPVAGAKQNGIIIDLPSSATGEDSYYSVWSNGANAGGIDYNNATPWDNWEAVIETDIIPLGSILEKKTLGNIEFKLDRPMATGDSIRVSWRPSLSDSYTLIGTTTTAVLSDYYQSNIAQAQWAQFKVEFDCASSGSSLIPLREIRIHYI